jgi:copper chaperone CopZ
MTKLRLAAGALALILALGGPASALSQVEVLEIGGWKCSACAEKTARILETELEGVEEASWDYDAGLIKVRYEDTIVSLEKIKQFIRERMGFKVAP